MNLLFQRFLKVSGAKIFGYVLLTLLYSWLIYN